MFPLASHSHTSATSSCSVLYLELVLLWHDLRMLFRLIILDQELLKQKCLTFRYSLPSKPDFLQSFDLRSGFLQYNMTPDSTFV
jgi:hypothetical protein